MEKIGTGKNTRKQIWNWWMAKITEFTVGRRMTINLGDYNSDQPNFSVTVELEDGDDFVTEVAKAVDTVNEVLLTIPETGGAEEPKETKAA